MPPDAAGLLQHYLAAAGDREIRALLRHLSGVAHLEIPPHLVGSMAVGLRRLLGEAAAREQKKSHALGQLTDREIQVLEAVAAGLCNRQAAEALGISERTVRNHIENIGKKLGVHSFEDSKITVRKIIHHVYLAGSMQRIGVSAD
ncbi:helix-turn-helix transcriptional regulator [Chromobacterium haemolyticum]|uniref:helix-turn-helix transcriptional regulator n=1 Tax=Chromobacterium haemolyticum TaxID=394935 RepID=UPI001B3B75B9|nr:helix-turn-helix transcriptional regulator [Chromobacterium haemolyticum]